MRSSGRTWHLTYLAHLWLLSPFLFLWLSNPSVARQLAPANMAAMRWFAIGILAYISIRTYFAWKSPKWLNWEYVFPPIDVVLVSVMLYIGDRDPLGNITLMYFLPIAEAAGTLNVIWAGTVGVMCVAGCMIGSFGATAEPAYNIAFRLSFLLISASLFTFLARIAARLKAQLDLARDRNRLALEMHDGVQAHLVAASAQLELLQRLTEGRPSELARATQGSVRDATDELRFVVGRMRAKSLVESFLPAFMHYAHNFCERSGLNLHFESPKEEFALSPDCEHALFRASQEALTNIAKHAEATIVTITFTISPNQLQMTIQDDGRGLGEATSGVGRRGMEERLHSVGGDVSLLPTTVGTKLVLTVPR